MKKINVELEDNLSKDIGKIAKDNGMSKHDWIVSAVTLVRDKYLAKKAAEGDKAKELHEEIQAITGSGILSSGTNTGPMKPLEETGQQPIPEYGQQNNPREKTLKLFIFFMNDGGEQQQTAYSLQEAMDELQIGENDFLDFTES